MTVKQFIRIGGIKIGVSDETEILYGRLTVIGRKFTAGNLETQVVCQCDCGAVLSVRLVNLKLGKSRCCARRGCRPESLDKSTAKAEYRNWQAMRARCNDPQNRCYAIYGARGISICERWDSFANFYSDMGPRPSDSHSIDRIDNNGNYEPGNCRWATQIEQSNNIRRNVRVTIYGRSLTVAQWSRISLVEHSVIRYRLRSGWDAKRAVFFYE